MLNVRVCYSGCNVGLHGTERKKGDERMTSAWKQLPKYTFNSRTRRCEIFTFLLFYYFFFFFLGSVHSFCRCTTQQFWLMNIDTKWIWQYVQNCCHFSLLLFLIQHWPFQLSSVCELQIFKFNDIWCYASMWYSLSLSFVHFPATIFIDRNGFIGVFLCRFSLLWPSKVKKKEETTEQFVFRDISK